MKYTLYPGFKNVVFRSPDTDYLFILPGSSGYAMVFKIVTITGGAAKVVPMKKAA